MTSVGTLTDATVGTLTSAGAKELWICWYKGSLRLVWSRVLNGLSSCWACKVSMREDTAGVACIARNAAQSLKAWTIAGAPQVLNGELKYSCCTARLL